MRRDFALPEGDLRLLERLALPWEAISQGGERWVVIRRFPIAPGYNVQTADIAVQIPAGYPDTQLDMVFVAPVLFRVDGKALRNTEATQQISGVTYQRWSRHRTSQNPWRAGEDNLETHLDLIRDWFRREFERVAA
jgi:hypothetical protein